MVPTLSFVQPAPVTLGPAVPSSTTLGAEIRGTLPPALLSALDSVGTQIQIEILDPLLSAPTQEQLTETFERVLPKFANYYESTIRILWGYFEQDPQRVAALTVRAYGGSEQFLREHGSQWLGHETMLSTLRGIATITKIAKASANFLETQVQAQASEAAVDWLRALIGYLMAFSSVGYALNQLV